MRCLLDRPETFGLVYALGIGHRLRAASVHDGRNIRLYSFGCPVLPLGRVMSEKTDIGIIPLNGWNIPEH